MGVNGTCDLNIIQGLTKLIKFESVVFSYWTKTLDMIEEEFRLYSIPYSRYDGGLSTARRAQALQRFSKSPEIVVLLASLSCGGLG